MTISLKDIFLENTRLGRSIKIIIDSEGIKCSIYSKFQDSENDNELLGYTESSINIEDAVNGVHEIANIDFNEEDSLL